MQNLFADTPEYIPFPSLVREVGMLMLETVRAGMLAGLVVLLLGHESAHTNHEAEPLMPPASHFELVQSSGGPAVPFIPMDDSANDVVIRNAYAQRQRVAWMASMTFSSPAILFNQEST